MDPVRRGETHRETFTEGKRPREDEAESRVRGPQTKNTWSHQELEEGKKDSHPEPLKELGSAKRLDFRLPASEL